MSNILSFYFGALIIRVLEYANQIWFAAKDVCDVLGLTNPTEALRPLDDDEKNTLRISEGIPGNPNINFINESGLYKLIFRSNKPEAKTFTKWVTSVVLPQIRKTGYYSPEDDRQSASGAMNAAKMIFEAAGIKDNQLALALDRIANHYLGHSMLALAGISLIAPTKNQLLTPTDIGKHFGVSARKVNQVLLDNLYQQREGRGYQPLKNGEPFAIMIDTTKRHIDGTPIRQLKWDSAILDEVSYLFS